LKHLQRDFLIHGVVFHHQDPTLNRMVIMPVIGVDGMFLGHSCLPLGEGNPKPECRPDTLDALNADLSLHEGDEVLANRQA